MLGASRKFLGGGFRAASGGTRLRSLAVCLLAALWLLLAAGGQSATAARSGLQQLRTPVLSVRRAPAWIEAQVAMARLDASVRPIWSSGPLRSRAATSCFEVGQDGRTLLAKSPDRELVPASNMKLLTATAALDKLGAGFRYTTAVQADSRPAEGRVAGNLYLVGGGDPVVRTPAYGTNAPYTSLVSLAAQVRAAGVEEVEGSVVGDESRYDTERAVPGWSTTYTGEGDVGPLSALEVDDGFHRTPHGSVADAQPALQAAQDFQALLVADGVRVDRPATTGHARPGAIGIAAIKSVPLGLILGAILKPSDDTAAELLTKELGRDFAGAATTAAGVAVIRQDMAADGLPVSDLAATDGSGLSTQDRLTCRMILGLLAREGASGILASDLPVAGRSGTLAARMVHSPAAGRVVAKTGTLRDVSALSGYVLPAASACGCPAAPTSSPSTSSPLVFSLIIDGIPVATGAGLADSLAEALASYPAVPPMADVGPR